MPPTTPTLDSRLSTLDRPLPDLDPTHGTPVDGLPGGFPGVWAFRGPDGPEYGFRPVIAFHECRRIRAAYANLDGKGAADWLIFPNSYHRQQNHALYVNGGKRFGYGWFWLLPSEIARRRFSLLSGSDYRFNRPQLDMLIAAYTRQQAKAA